jgi:hypothetical protein
VNFGGIRPTGDNEGLNKNITDTSRSSSSEINDKEVPPLKETMRIIFLSRIYWVTEYSKIAIFWI